MTKVITKDGQIKKQKPHTARWRKVLYIVSVPLLLVEWGLDLCKQIIDAARKSTEILYLSIENYINEPTEPPGAGD